MTFRFARIHMAFGLVWLIGAIGFTVYAIDAWELTGWWVAGAAVLAAVAVLLRLYLFASVLESDRELDGEADSYATGLRAGAVDFACAVPILFICWAARVIVGYRVVLGWMVGGALVVWGFYLSTAIGVFVAQRATARADSAYAERRRSSRPRG